MTFWNATGPRLVSTKGVAVSSRPEDRLQLVNRPHARRRAVAMRFVHEQHKIAQTREIVEVAFADLLLEARECAATARRAPRN